MKMPKKVLSLLFAGSSMLGLGSAAYAQNAGPPPAPTGVVEMQNNNVAAPEITQADIDNFAYNVGVQTAFPLAREGFSQGTLRSGQYVGLQFVLDGSNRTTGYSVYNLEDPQSQVAFQKAIDNANRIENKLENERYFAGYATPVVYPESYIICAPVYVPPLWGFGWGFGHHYRIGIWEPVVWPGFIYMGGMGYHDGYGGGWEHGHGYRGGGVRNDIRNTTVINNTTIINNGHRGNGNNNINDGHNNDGHWATGRGAQQQNHPQTGVVPRGTEVPRHMETPRRDETPRNIQQNNFPQRGGTTHRFEGVAQPQIQRQPQPQHVEPRGGVFQGGAIERGGVRDGGVQRMGNVVDRGPARVINGNGGGRHH